MAPPSRQERLQMRQRGAGARKVDNIDFGFSFGLTPGRAQRSVRRTPRPSNAGIRRSSKTPTRNGRQSSIRRSVRSVSATIEASEKAAKDSTRPVEDRKTHVDKPAAKRRKTKEGHNPEPPAAAHRPRPSLVSSPLSNGLSSRTSKARRRTSGPAFVQIAEDPEDVIVSEHLGQSSHASIEPTEPSLEPQHHNITGDKENAAPDEEMGIDDSVTIEKPKRKTKKRRSIGQQSGRRKKRPSNDSVQSMAEEPVPDDPVSKPIEGEPEWETMIGDESSLLPEEIPGPSHESTPPSKKRRKRKSIVLKPRKQKPSGKLSTPGVVGAAEDPHHGNDNIRDKIEQVVPPKSTPKAQYSRAARQRESNASNIQTPGNGPTYEPEIEGDETYIDEAISPEKPTPKAPSKKAKAKATKRLRSGSDVRSGSSRQVNPSSRLKKSSKATFPILTLRMTNISALPTIDEEAENDADIAADVDSLKTKFTDRSAPNAVDVLAQICRETISTTLSKMSTSSSIVSTREMKRKRSAIEAFGAEIDSRLFDMSVAIEHRLTMEARVKKARKAKSDAQNEWLEIRRQRQEIALKCDDVRARNSRIEAERTETYQLSERLHELEMVVEKPELDRDDSAGDGLEYMLRSVAKSVSCVTGDGGGLLDRVKAYNRQLERTALVLEGRELG